MEYRSINSALSSNELVSRSEEKRPQQDGGTSKSLLDQILHNSGKKATPYRQKTPPVYRNIGLSSAVQSPVGLQLSLESHLDSVRSPYQSRVSFDTVNIDVSPSEGVDPEEYPDYYGLDSNSAFLSFGRAKVADLYEKPRTLSRAELAKMSDAEYRKYLKDQRKQHESTRAMHNQVCCYIKMHKDFNLIYHSYHWRNLNKKQAGSQLLPVFPRRVVLVYISGRKHTWVALDWAIKKLLANGDHLVVVASVFPELVNKINVHGNDASSTSADHHMYGSELLPAAQGRTNRFQTDYDFSGSRSRSAARSRSRSNLRSTSSSDFSARFKPHDDSHAKNKDIDVIHKVKNIMKYIMSIAGPNLIIKITIDLSIGGTKDVLKDSYVLYTPSLVVCSAKPRENSAPMRSWKSSRLTDRVVKNFTIPVIVVPALNMGKFEKYLFDNLSEQMFPVARNTSSVINMNNSNELAKPQTLTAPPSLNNLAQTSNNDKTSISNNDKTSLSNNDKTSLSNNDKSCPSSNNNSPTSIIVSNANDPIQESSSLTDSLTQGSGTPMNQSSDAESEISIDSEASESEDSSDSELSDSEMDEPPAVSTVLPTTANENNVDIRRQASKKRTSRPKLLRLKTLIGEMNYETAPDLSTKEKIKNFVMKQEKKLDENLKKIPIELEPSSTTDLTDVSAAPQWDPNYFKNQLELISAGSLFITRKLKSLDFSDDVEGAELVRSITGDPNLLQPKKFKSMLLDDDTSSNNTRKTSNRRIPAAEINAKTKNQGYYPKKSSSLRFDTPKPPSKTGTSERQTRPKLETTISAPDIILTRHNVSPTEPPPGQRTRNNSSGSIRHRLSPTKSNTLEKSIKGFLGLLSVFSSDDSDNDRSRSQSRNPSRNGSRANSPEGGSRRGLFGLKKNKSRSSSVEGKPKKKSFLKKWT